jgi:hypothetical protein
MKYLISLVLVVAVPLPTWAQQAGAPIGQTTPTSPTAAPSPSTRESQEGRPLARERQLPPGSSPTQPVAPRAPGTRPNEMERSGGP